MSGPAEVKETNVEREKRLPRRRRLSFLLLAAAITLGAYFGIRHLLHARAYQSTDDAFVDAHVVGISPRVSSYASRVLIDDNMHVQQGQLLVELDPRDFEAQLNKARADLAGAIAQHKAASINVRVVDKTSTGNEAQAEASVSSTASQVEAARSQIGQAQAERIAAQAESIRATADVERYQQLIKTNAVSRQQTDNAIAISRTANAKLDAARRAEQTAVANLSQTEGQLQQARGRLVEARAAPDQRAYSRSQVQQAQALIAQLEAAVRLAELELSYTKIYAPASGYITRKSIEPGDYIQVGQRIFSIVPDQIWVVANFKETQLRHIRRGQQAMVRFDAYPDREFRGHVESIQAGSGAAFSLLPPENATGNYVKVVQRIPVKIVIDERPDPNHVIGPGMSAVPTVKVR